MPFAAALRGAFATSTDVGGAYAFDGVMTEPRRFRPSQLAATHPTRGDSVPQPVPPGDATVDLVLSPAGTQRR